MSRQPMGEFLEACGATGPLVLRVEDGSGTEAGRWALPQPFAVIGRDAKADVTLEDHEGVSRRHAYLQVIAGRVYGLDLNSRTGLTWGGVAAPAGWLGRGEAIGLGPYRVRLEARWAGDTGPGALPSPLAARSLGPGALPGVVLEFPDQASGAARWRLGRVLTLVGRAPDCRLRIPDDRVSRFHCALLRTPGGLWAVDLLSREGIRVEGVPVRWARLEDGDRLHVGRYRIRVRHVGPAEAGRGRADGPGADELGPDSSELDIPPLPPDQLPALAGRSPAPSRVTRRSGPLRRSRSERPLPPDVVLEPLTDQFALMQERLFEQHQARFGQMQQQMFEQFHQAMIAMFQMFGTLQREQMGQVHEDLDRIQELTRELQALQAEASRRAAAGPAPGLVAAPPEMAPGSSPEPDRPQVSATPAGVVGPSEPEAPPPPRSPRPDRTRPDRPADPPPPDMHAQIYRRIAELQGERQSRWQKIFGLVTGGGAAP